MIAETVDLTVLSDETYDPGPVAHAHFPDSPVALCGASVQHYLTNICFAGANEHRHCSKCEIEAAKLHKAPSNMGVWPCGKRAS